MLTAGFYLKSPVRYTKNKLPIIQFVYHLLVTLLGFLNYENIHLNIFWCQVTNSTLH